MVLLDTCTFLWLVLDQSHLSDSARSLIAQSTGQVFISPITAFELGQKVARGKLVLARPASEWFPLALKLHGLREALFDSRVALTAAGLPDFHRDPFDRLLVATAQVLNLTLLTPDPLIHQYSPSSVLAKW